MSMPKLQRTLSELLCLAGLAISLLLPALDRNSLPAIIPIHFDLGGSPDGWGSRWWLVIFAGMNAGLYLFLSAVEAFPGLSRRHDRSAEHNARKQALTRSLMRWLKPELVLMFLFLEWSMIEVALGRAAGLNIWLTFGFMAAIFVTIGATICQSRRGA